MKTKLLLLLAILNISIVSSQTFTVDGIKYDIIPSTTNVEVVANTPKYTGAVTIPESVIYNAVTYVVTSIGEYAFYNCAGLTSITIPNSVTSIGTGVFYNCTGLTTVNIPNSVTSIGVSAFQGCSGLTSITIPNSVTSILQDTFVNCSGLTSITIPNLVTSIGNFAFAGCSGLTSVIIPNSVISIGYGAFQSCTSLTSVTIPNSVTSIEQGVFEYCTSLTTVNCAIETPLVINANVFSDFNQALCTLNVPASSVSLYQAADVWKDFNPINGALSTESFINKNNIKLYPNPVQNKLFLELNNANKTNIEVVDINGKVIITKSVNNITNSIDTSSLATGLYLLKVKANNGNTQTIKFIKN